VIKAWTQGRLGTSNGKACVANGKGIRLSWPQDLPAEQFGVQEGQSKLPFQHTVEAPSQAENNDFP
jgi:hypothetical protein